LKLRGEKSDFGGSWTFVDQVPPLRRSKTTESLQGESCEMGSFVGRKSILGLCRGPCSLVQIRVRLGCWMANEEPGSTSTARTAQQVEPSLIKKIL
jgi:hypothetical protein